MRIVLAAFTAHGVALEQCIRDALLKGPVSFHRKRDPSCTAEDEREEQLVVDLYASRKYYSACPDVRPIEPSLTEWTGSVFSSCDALVFISASGIAVRAIAPYVRSKKEDPAVLCMDEQAHFCISLLSGHIGGANELTEEICQITGAIPVITTATDANGLFAVDVFAVKNRLAIREMDLAREVAAALVDGKKVALYTECALSGQVPPELILVGDMETAAQYPLGICISYSDTRQPFKETLHLIPGDVTLGIGCKRQKEAEVIERRVLRVLAEQDLSVLAVRKMASIDLKAEEPGLLALSAKYGWPFKTYPSEVLGRLSGAFTPSAFVSSVTGVDNVCERSAVAEGGVLLITKQAGDGVTVAAAREERKILF